MLRRMRLWIALLGVFSLILVGSAHAGSRLLGNNVQVTDDAFNNTEFGEANRPDVAVNGYKVYAVWEDSRDDPLGSAAEIYFARSTDGGATWSTDVNLSQDVVDGIQYPAIAADATGWVYVIWASYLPPDPAEYAVYMTRSNNHGQTFETPWMLGYHTAEYYSFDPEIAAEPSGGYVYVVINAPWTSDTYTVYVARSEDYGESWPGGWQQVNDVNGAGVSDESFYGPQMSIVASDAIVCVAWEDGRDGGMRIYGDCSTDHGAHWGTDFAISPSGVTAAHPHLALAPDGALYAAYQVDDTIYVRRSTNNGTSWSSPVRVATDITEGPPPLHLNWDMAVDGNGTVAIVWMSEKSYITGDQNINLSTSIDDGQSFTTLSGIQDFDGGHEQPAIAATGSGDYARAYLVWDVDSADNDQIWSVRAELDATPPTTPSNLRATPGDTVVDLTWDPATDRNGIGGYYVLRATQSGGPYTVINPFIITDTSYRDVGLSSGTYYYKVYAVDGTGNVGSTSNEVSAAVTAGSDLPLNGTLAYEAGTGDVRLNDLPGLSNERTLAQGESPHFSSDGSRVYYYSSGAILSRPTGGGNAQTHYTDANLTSWFDLPDDTSYFARIEQQFYAGINPGEMCYAWEPRYGPFSGSDIYVASQAMAQSVTLSPDRRWLAYTTVGWCTGPSQGQYTVSRLCLVNLSTQEKTCTEDLHNYQDPDFAPSGGWLVFAADFSGRYEIWKAQVQSDGSLTDLTQLTRSDDKWSLQPAWSSDGNWVVFVRGTPAGDDVRLPDLQNPRLYAVRANGASLRALNVAGEEPAWTGGGPAGGGSHRVYLPLVVRP